MNTLGKSLVEVVPKGRARLGKAYSEAFEEIAQALAQVPQGLTSGQEGKGH